MAVNPRHAATLQPPKAAPPLAESAGAPIRQSSLWRDAYRRYLGNKGAVASAVVFTIIVLYCLFIPGFWFIPGIWPRIFDIDPNQVNFAETRLPPSLEHPFGTDQFGRDLWSRTVYGTRVSLVVGVTVAILSISIGLVVGMLAGYIRLLDTLSLIHI